MSWLSDTVELDAGAWLSSAYAGLGIPGYAIPSAGVSGASPVRNDSTSDTEEYRWRLVSGPTAGSLVLYEDTSFDFYGAADGDYAFTYRLYESGADAGTAIVALHVGPPTAAIAVTTAAALFSGSASSSGTATTCAIAATTADAIFAGSAARFGSAFLAAVTADAVATLSAASSATAAVVATTSSVVSSIHVLGDVVVPSPAGKPLDTTEPLLIRAGDSVSWSRLLPEFSADDGWTLKYRILWTTGSSPAAFSAFGFGEQHIVGLDALTTADWPAGRATLFIFVERTVGPATERISLEAKAIEIAPNLAIATAFDARSANAKALDDLKAALASYCTAGQGPVAEYSIGDRRMKFRSTTEIVDLIAFYERQVARERGVTGRVFYRG